MIRVFSIKGKRHEQNGQGNQDVVKSGSNERFSVITLADGVSTCKKARKGAQIACRATKSLMLGNGEYIARCSSRDLAWNVVYNVNFELQKQAAKDQTEPEEYSSTLSSVLYDKRENTLTIFSVGDGIVFGVGKKGFRILAMPSDSREGTCVTTTRGAFRRAVARTIGRDGIDAVWICSDGAWREMFEYGRMKREVAELIENKNFRGLMDLFKKRHSNDDMSFIALDVALMKGGALA